MWSPLSARYKHIPMHDFTENGNVLQHHEGHDERVQASTYQVSLAQQPGKRTTWTMQRACLYESA